MDPRSTLAAAAWLIVCSAGGVALGGYTIGSFHLGGQAQPQASGEDARPLAAADPTGWASTQPPLAPAAPYHVCKGCDAHPYHDGQWTQHYVSYDDDRAAPPAVDDNEDDDAGESGGATLASTVSLYDETDIRPPRLSPAGT